MHILKGLGAGTVVKNRPSGRILASIWHQQRTWVGGLVVGMGPHQLKRAERLGGICATLFENKEARRSREAQMTAGRCYRCGGFASECSFLNDESKSALNRVRLADLPTISRPVGLSSR